jgi:DNA-binding GntR family transcriptional regulator
VNERIRPVRTYDFITSGRIAATVAQHLGVLDAVLDKAVARSVELLDDHISESQHVVELAVARVLERMLNVADRDRAW